MFHRLPTVCILFCLIAKCILINSINRLNLITFLIREKWVLCEVETKYLHAIFANVRLQDVRIINVFYSFVTPVHVYCRRFSRRAPKTIQRNVSFSENLE